MRNSGFEEGCAEASDSRLLTSELRARRLAWGVSAPPRTVRRGCLHTLFELQAARSPDQVALVFENEHMTYRGLSAASDRLARRLRSMGVCAGSTIGVLAPRSIHAVIGYLAALKAGAAYLPLDPAHPSERSRAILDEAAASILLADRGDEPLTHGFARVLWLGQAVLEAESPAPPQADGVPEQTQAQPRDLAYIIFTSGSSGKPKGVMVEHAAAVALCDWMAEYLTEGPREVAT